MIKQIQLLVALESWDTLNLLVDTVAQFTENDPAVTALLRTSGMRVKNITEGTRVMLADHLQRAYEKRVDY